MAVYTIYEFTDVTPGNEDPVYPPIRRQVNCALDAFNRVGDTAHIRGILVYNATGAGMHVRVATEQSVAAKADQNDTFVGVDQNAWILVHRKDRSGNTDPLYIYATADT